MKEIYIAFTKLLGQYEEPDSDSSNSHKFRTGRWLAYNSNLRDFPEQDGRKTSQICMLWVWLVTLTI